ncbi:MAG: 50S ribosomal protein L11 methyltransferase [Vallitalea sp.]|nr:50S ribosomal protein L11 methyltransferase [Vallitalea sp.]
MKWTQCEVYIDQEAIEAVSYMLTEQGIQGIEVIDHTLSEKDMKEIIIDYVEEGILDNKKDTYIRFYLSDQENVTEKLNDINVRIEELRKYIKVGLGKIEVSSIDDEDWANNWKKYYKPFRIDNKIIIKPTWENYSDVKDEDVVIEIDPGMAFGSGTHETTSMCVSLINKYLTEDDIVIDVGCGSGILGIAAAKLGAKEVVCIDLDKNAVKASKDNAETNKVNEKVKVLNGDLLKLIDINGNIVVANIMADIIINLTSEVRKYLVSDGLFISSGIILDKVKDVEDALISSGFEILEIRYMGEWSAIVAKPVT